MGRSNGNLLYWQKESVFPVLYSCISIVRRHLKNSDSGYIKDLPTDWKRNQ
jgi:hypothetical protein